VRTLRVSLVLGLLALASAPAALPAATPLDAAYAKTATAKTLRLTMTGKVATAGLTVPFSAVGEADNRAGRSHFDFDLSKAAGVGGLRARDLKPELVVDLRPPVMYVRWPLLAQSLGVARPWVKLDLARVARTMPQLGQISDLVRSADISAALRLARLASGPVRTLGHERVRGSDTTHFRTAIRYARLAQTLPSSARAALLKVGSRSAPLDVWVDGDGYVRRLSYSYAAPTQQGAVRTTTSFEFYDFDVDVQVMLPPASQVGEPAQLKGKRS
jgi:hypothetical protein